jgi:hypothetical protein
MGLVKTSYPNFDDFFKSPFPVQFGRNAGTITKIQGGYNGQIGQNDTYIV